MGASGKITKQFLPAPAFWAAAAFALGIFAAALAIGHFPFWLVFSAVCGLAALGFHLRSHAVPANFGFLLLLAGLGGLRYSSATDLLAGRSVANFAGLGKRMLISGRVCELPEVKPERARIYLDQIGVGWKSRIELGGKIRLVLDRPVTSFAVGDRIEFVGMLDSLRAPANPGMFDFARGMRIRGVEGTVYLKDGKRISLVSRNPGGRRSSFSQFRERVEKKLTAGLMPTAAGVVKGFVLGITRDIEPSTYDLFRKTGTLHLLAVSGANVAWVALLPIYLLKLLHVPLRWRYLAALGAVWIFVLLTDLQASVLRAAIMFTVWAGSRILFREISGLQSLGLSGLLLLVINPLWFFDIGFQLSFLAVLALVLVFSERNDRVKGARRYADWIFLNNFKSSVAVFFFVVPLLAYHFNQVAWTSLLVNVAAMPLAALITWCALLRLGSGFWGASTPLVALQEKLFDWLFGVQQFFGKLPEVLLRVPHPTGAETALLTLAGLGLLFLFFRPQQRKAGAYLFLLGLTPVVWIWGLNRANDFSLSVLEAKGEVTAVLALPGRTVGIGGGEIREGEHTPRQVWEPFLAFLGKEKLDGYLPLRFDSTGLAASAEVARNFGPDFIGWPADGPPSGASADLKDIRFDYLRAAGDSLPFALRLRTPDLTFLFMPQLKRLDRSQWDSLLTGSIVLVAPVDFSQAESLSFRSNVRAVVSTWRGARRPQMLPDWIFFTHHDGAVTFRKKKAGWMARNFLSGRNLALDNR